MADVCPQGHITVRETSLSLSSCPAVFIDQTQNTEPLPDLADRKPHSAQLGPILIFVRFAIDLNIDERLRNTC